ncbi:hypothetical protein [Veillonella sp. VA139]|uniref:hypothetical protein n=1 Tax=Veillonella sp. VA139 TaxID=741830 RepID=UPI000F8C633D|nr:hypothetical protein [Veillonella sp. VA139]
MKILLTTMVRATIREYKNEHFDWVIRMSFHVLESMKGQIRHIQFPPNYCLQYRDSDVADSADLSAETSKLRIEIEAMGAALLGILESKRSQMDDNIHIAGVVRLLEQVEVDLARSESVISDILVDPEDFMYGLSTCIKLLKLHLELFTVSDKDLE